jgi:hypothetical protein
MKDLKRIRLEKEISSFTDRAADCIKNGESMCGNYNIAPISKHFYEYYIYKSRDVKFFIGTLAELKIKLKNKTK